MVHHSKLCAVFEVSIVSCRTYNAAWKAYVALTTFSLTSQQNFVPNDAVSRREDQKLQRAS